MRRRARAGLAAVLASPLFATAQPTAATTATARACAAPMGVYQQGTPWPQRLFDPPRLWPLSDGTGQTVAVIGTGVDAKNRQFRPGQVLHGTSVNPPGTRADSDCDGRGTFAAGIVAARADPSTTFTGIAPGVRVLPIRYLQSTDGNAAGADPKLLARAVRTAVDAHAGVVLVAVPSEVDAPQLRDAVAYAIRRGAVVVSPAAARDAGTRSYPTAYPNVIGVGAVDANGVAVSTEAGDGIVLAAPGAELVSTAANAHGRAGHRWQVKDAQFAAAYVAGAAALLRAYLPALTPEQVRLRLIRTADRFASGERDPRLGWGTVNPYAALTAVVSAGSPAGAAAGPARIAPAPAPAATRRPDPLPGLLALGGLLLAGLVAVAAAAARRGNARNWLPGRVSPPARLQASNRR